MNQTTFFIVLFAFCVVAALIKTKYHAWLRKHDWWNWYSNIYLKSAHWQRYRHFRLWVARYTCERCNKKRKVLQIHHLNYDHLWHEKIKDTWVLCVPCHNRIHEK